MNWPIIRLGPRWRLLRNEMQLNQEWKGIVLGALALALAAPAVAQINPPGITKASLAFHQYRMVETKPRFEFWKVDALVKKIKRAAVKDSDDEAAILDKKDYDQLDVPGKYTYCMIHPETYSQNCDGMPAFLNEQNLVFARPCEPFGGEGQWSDRQRAFLHKNRRAVIKLLSDSIKSTHRVCCNLKAAIVEINAVELIPQSMAIYKEDHKDHDILSMFSMLMKNGKYAPYSKTALYKKFYGDQSSFQASELCSKTVETMILDDATRFAASHKS